MFPETRITIFPYIDKFKHYPGIGKPREYFTEMWNDEYEGEKALPYKIGDKYVDEFQKAWTSFHPYVSGKKNIIYEKYV